MDLFSYLKNKFVEQYPDKNKKDLDAVDVFIDYCQKELLRNNPVALDYRTRGMGVIFQNGMRATFLVEGTPEADSYSRITNEYVPEIPVTFQSRLTK